MEEVVNLNLSHSFVNDKKRIIVYLWVYMQNVLDEYGKEQQSLFEKKIRRKRFTNGTLNEYKCALFYKCMSSFIEIRVLKYKKYTEYIFVSCKKWLMFLA